MGIVDTSCEEELSVLEEHEIVASVEITNYSQGRRSDGRARGSKGNATVLQTDDEGRN